MAPVRPSGGGPILAVKEDGRRIDRRVWAANGRMDYSPVCQACQQRYDHARLASWARHRLTPSDSFRPVPLSLHPISP